MENLLEVGFKVFFEGGLGQSKKKNWDISGDKNDMDK